MKYNPPITGWQYTDAINHVDCPKCGSMKGHPCRTPKGRKTYTPHVERLIDVGKVVPKEAWMTDGKPGQWERRRAFIEQLNNTP